MGPRGRAGAGPALEKAMTGKEEKDSDSGKSSVAIHTLTVRGRKAHGPKGHESLWSRYPKNILYKASLVFSPWGTLYTGRCSGWRRWWWRAPSPYRGSISIWTTGYEPNFTKVSRLEPVFWCVSDRAVPEAAALSVIGQGRRLCAPRR